MKYDHALSNTVYLRVFVIYKQSSLSAARVVTENAVRESAQEREKTASTPKRAPILCDITF